MSDTPPQEPLALGKPRKPRQPRKVGVKSYDGPDRRKADPDIVHLRAVTESLANQVINLQGALGDANELHRRQLQLEVEARTAREDARQANQRTEQLERVVVPREEMEKRQLSDSQERAHRRRQITRRLLVGAMVALLVAACIGTVALYALHKGRQTDSLGRSNAALIGDLKNAATRGCVQRNTQQDAQRTLWRNLLHSEIVNSDPTVPPEVRKERISAYTLALNNVTANIDCSIYQTYQPGHVPEPRINPSR